MTFASADPLFSNGVHVTLAILIIVLVKVLVGFAVIMGAVTLMIWFERKAISDMQSRIGPQRWGPFGLLQTLADGIKLFAKEDLMPAEADRFVFKLAPYLVLVPALITFSVIPLGGTVTVAGHVIQLQIANPPMGILVMLAMSGISVYGIMLAGWASGSKYPLLSSVRASAQMISYEAALGMTIVTVALISGSLSTHDIVNSQGGGIWHWNLIRLGFVPFIVFVIAITAELGRPPFDVVEAESELVGGFHTEYSSIRFALFFMAEFMNTLTMSALIVTLFLGGPAGYVPNISHLRWVFPILWFLAKTTAFAFSYIWFRAALPRFRYDQVMELGWKRLIPLSLGWMLIVAGFLVKPADGFAMAAVVILAWTLLSRAFELGADRASGVGALMPIVGERPVPGEVIRAVSDAMDDEDEGE
ncbi:MAG: NADH-quinone oxidoreductase subunit NuoH [Acidimicrobiaceae bacterium]|nr:NADH-quinone oxidoreductase subunit NuoH [Acidimicrobiaceae bacterium]